MAKSNIVAGLDIGTSKVCCMIGEITSSGDIDVLGYGITAASGIKKGNIINIDSVVQSIIKAVDLAQQMAGIRINSVIAGISGSNISLLNNRGVVGIPRKDQEISAVDVERVLQAARIMAMPYDREILNIIPREFIVDGCDSIKDPIGMNGIRLEVSACIVAGQLSLIQNITRCIQRAGLMADSLVLKPLAAAEMILTQDDMEMGVALVDIGAGTTEVATFQNGCIEDYAIIPVGGDFVTSDIAIGLRVPFGQAEEIKRKYACARGIFAAEESNIDIQCIGETTSRKISQRDLSDIVEPRVLEILSLVSKVVHDFNSKKALPAGVVFTGGGLIHIRGSIETARQFLGLPARLGVTDSYDKEQTFTVALGLLNYVVNHGNHNPGIAVREKSSMGFLEKARRFFSEYF